MHVLVFVILHVSTAIASPLVSGKQCCALLSSTLGNSIVSYPNSSIYATEQTGLPYAGYWTQQESDLQPACRVSPEKTSQVAAAVEIARQHECRFAIRGGGHTTWAGAANIGNQGFTIDLSRMDSIKLAPNMKTVTIGAGVRWIDVYQVLDTMNLSIAGGREAPVGVAGLTLGGGKSFFSDQVGFVCDGLHSVEIVTGDCSVLHASNNSHPDLFKAIKGGNNNFGIVTSFTFNTFPQGDLWGGLNINPGSTASQQMTALANFVEATKDLTNGVEVIISYVNIPSYGSLFTNYFINTNATPFPSALSEFTAIEPVLINTFRVDNLSSFALELSAGQDSGKRYQWATATFKNDVALFNYSLNTFRTMFDPLIANGTASLIANSYQVLNKAMLAHGCGQNSLGLCADAGPLIVMNYNVAWSNANDDAMITKLQKDYLNAVTKEAKRRKAFNNFVYMNYALPSQNPVASYGTASLQEMRAVSGKYDPEMVFQRLVPGGYKLRG